MKNIAILILGIICVAVFVHAVPPSSPTRAELTKQSDLVAIVTVTNIKDHVSTDVAWKQGRRQSALAIVDRTLKGTAPRTLRLTFEGLPLSSSCQAPSLSVGQFLVFLRRQGDKYVRTDTWYGQAAIATNHVSFTLGHPVLLKTVLGEIERTVRSQ